MRRLPLYIISISILIGQARAPSELKFGEFDKKVPNTSFLNGQDLNINKQSFVLEQAVNPEEYIIGPGDIFGININTMEKFFFSSKVGPSGDILIPGVGLIFVSGINLINSIKMISNRIAKTYNNAEVDISIIGLKSFKIQIFGAVINPGFAVIDATSRLDIALDKVGGLHRYANEDNILITNLDGSKKNISLLKYLSDGDLINNPQISEGDKVFVQFESDYIAKIDNNLTYKKVPVLVSGFVNEPGAINYFPGYNVKDYIGLAGGVSDMGNTNKVYLYRQSKKINASDNVSVLPGDHIIVPEGTFAVLFGKNSFLQNLTALFSIISTYTIISDRLSN